ncbi:kinase-like protein [Lindgomyces ingoldianus]|uniref:Kinase-like protein n=1 Tax=Lindgomyces ingoldianus TaxID=673940 RepID=A0ACB6R7S5_9PLEO|nr:kinase-like protein [Lindgomyces ingoldianus]KAF2474367.1 kinase-like protein [Lindgomyces ingoldianus]
MSTDDDLTFFKPRYLSDASLESVQEADAPYDLITFLAVIQKLQVDILPTTWQAARQPIGVGATGIINEALIDLHTSFAFKRASNRQKEKQAEERIIHTLISEVIALGHPLIRKHRNIVELQGICWDIVSDDRGNDKVWPVLVFEKSQYGDLYSFATLPVGRALCVAERLKLCVDVGIAILDMHFNKIIHGDIKPENVLVFKDDAGAYTARVTDFGYSTRFAGEDDLVSVPKSWPWCAPECEHEKLKPIQARKMDVFSFGMLCLWVLFEKYLSGITPHMCKSILADLKQQDRLAMLAQQLVLAERDIETDKKKALERFFSTSLARNPDERDESLSALPGLLIPTW